MTDATKTGVTPVAKRELFSRRLRLVTAISAPLLLVLEIVLWVRQAEAFMFFVFPLLLACLAMSLAMAIRWREWRALPVSLVFVLLTLWAWLRIWVPPASVPAGRILLQDIFLFLSVPAAVAAIAGLWRIFENHALFEHGQREMLEYEGRYRHLIENAMDAFYVADANGLLTLVNAAAARLFGRRADDLMGLSIYDLVDEETGRLVRGALENMRLKDVKASYQEFWIVRRDDTRRWVGQNLQLVRSGKEIRGFQAVLRDITDRYEVQETLRESEARLRTLFETLSEGVLQTRADGHVVFCNPASLRILGLAAADIQNRHCADPVWELVRPDGTRMPIEEWVAFRVHRERRSIPRKVTGVRRRDGSVAWINAGAEPILGAEGQLQGAVVTFADITKSKAAEENLQIIEFALDSAREQVFLATREGRLVYANKSAMESLGYGPDNILALSIFEIARDVTKDDWNETWQQAKGGAWPTFEAHFTARDGRSYPASTSVSYVEFNGREYLFAFSHDLSRETELATQLRHAQKMEAIGTLAGGIAHDFNNILSGVLGYTELALRDSPKGTRVRAFLEEVMAGGYRAADLVRQILTFSRRGEQKHQPLLMPPVVKEAIKLLRGSLPATITIGESIDANCGPIMGDPSQIHQVMMNLCTNAYHAMRETGGTLTIGLREVDAGPEWTSAEFCLASGRYAELSVEDTGHGMEAATRQRIFEPFFTTKKQGEGTGLGLSTVHGIVKSHKGGIRVQSEPGKGTRFEVLFPLCQREMAQGADEALDAPLPGGKETLLLIDDESAIIDSMGEGLRDLGYTVETAVNGKQGWDRFIAQPERYSLVITDYTMPQMTGLELARRVLRTLPGQRILLCTGFDDLITREAVQGEGIAELLTKPYTVSVLARTVRRILDKPR